jgi:hypothetical protein
MKMGYQNSFWQSYFTQLIEGENVAEKRSRSRQTGVWCTCYIAFNMRSRITLDFSSLGETSRGDTVLREGESLRLASHHHLQHHYSQQLQQMPLHQNIILLNRLFRRANVYPTITNHSISGSSSAVTWELTISDLLRLWYDHNRVYSTQDQVSFPFLLQLLNIHPISLPDEDEEIYGNFDFNSFFVKLDHGF